MPAQRVKPTGKGLGEKVRVEPIQGLLSEYYFPNEGRERKVENSTIKYKEFWGENKKKKFLTVQWLQV